VDRKIVLQIFEETKSGMETARRVGLHENTVYGILREHRGKCLDCANDASLGHKYCKKCLSRIRNRARDKRKNKKRLGICVQCNTQRTPLSKLYCEEHRLQHLSSSQCYKNRQRKSRGDLPTEKQRLCNIKGTHGENGVLAWQRDEGKCVICERIYGEIAIHIHHMDDNKKNNSVSNLCCLCWDCHALVTRVSKHYKPELVFNWIKQTCPSILMPPN